MGGIHGVGKSTFCKSIASKINAEHLSASKLISMAKKENITKNKRVENIDRNQDILIYAINEYLDDKKLCLLDGHFCLINETGGISKVPEQTYRSIFPVAIIVLHDEPDKIHTRLNERDNENYNLEFIKNFQEQELIYSKDVANNLNIPHLPCNPFTDQNNTYRFIGDILGKETI